VKHTFWTSLFCSLCFLLPVPGSAFSVPEGKTNGANSQSNANETYDVPEETADPQEKPVDPDSFSSLLNSLEGSKEIVLSPLTVQVQPSQGDVLSLTFTDFDLDLSKLSTLDLSFSTTLKASYGSYTDSFLVRWENDVVYFGLSASEASYSYRFDAPKTLSSLVQMLNAVGLPVESSSDASLSDLLTPVATAVKNASVTSAESDYAVTIPAFTAGSTSVSEASLTLTGKNGFFTGFSLPSLVLSPKEESTKKTTLSLSGSVLSHKDASGYTFLTDEEKAGYADLTPLTTSLLSTVAQVFDEKQASFGIQGSLTLSQDDSTTVDETLSGTLLADNLSTFQDYTSGRYLLSLSHGSGTEVYNTLSARYEGHMSYLKLNDAFKAKISNTSLEELFSYLDEAESTTGKSHKKGLLSSTADLLNLVVSAAPSVTSNTTYVSSLSLLDGGFEAVLKGEAFSLSEDFTLDVLYDKTTEKITSLTLKNLSFSSLRISSLTLTYDGKGTVPALTEEEKAYSDYAGIVPVFTTLSSLVESKQMSANYAMIFTDADTKTYSASGALKADLSGIQADGKGFSKTPTVEELYDYYGKGTYGMTFDVKKADNTESVMDQSLFVQLQEKNLYFSYGYVPEGVTASHTVMKNVIPESTLGKIPAVLDSYASTSETESTAESFFTMDTLLSALSSSQAYKDLIQDLKKGKLSSLDGLLSASADGENLVLSLDPSTLFASTSYAGKVGSLSLSFSTAEKKLSAIQLTANLPEKRNIQLSLSFAAYADFALSAEEKSGYAAVTDADLILSGAFSLPTQMQKFNLAIEGSVSEDGRDILKIDSGSGISADVSDRDKESATGRITLEHVSLNEKIQKKTFSLAKQDILFTYGSLTSSDSNPEGQFLIQYNKNMHVLLKRSTIRGVLKETSRVTDESNLLYRYLGVLSDVSKASSVPLMNLINGKSLADTGILSVPYLQEVLFDSTAHTLTLKVDPALLDSSDTRKATDTLVLTFDATKKQITKATIEGSVTTTEDGTTKVRNVSASLAFTDTAVSFQSGEFLSYSGNESKFVDMEGFSTLTKCLIDTTEYNIFQITGKFDVTPKVIGITVSAMHIACLAKVAVYDEHAYAYLAFSTNASSYDNQKSITDSGFYLTEFFVSEQEVEVNRTRNQSGSISSEHFKVTKDELVKNVMYYVIDYILDIDDVTGGSLATGKIYEAAQDQGDSDVAMNDDLSEVLKSAVYTSSTRDFKMVLNLEKLFYYNGTDTLSGVSFEDTTVDVYHLAADADGKTPFSSITLSTKLTAYLILSASADFSFGLSLKSEDAATAKSSTMARYCAFTSQFKADCGGFSPLSPDDDTFSTGLPPYVITAIKPKYSGWLIKYASGYTLTDNASVAKKTLSNSDYQKNPNSVYFGTRA